MGFLKNVARGWKALTRDQLRFPGQPPVWFGLNRTPLDEIVTEVGDGTNSDILMSTVRWLQRVAVEAPLVAEDGEGNPAESSALQAVIDKPNPFYGLDTLMAGTVHDLSISGNAYWLPVANQNAKVLELWWAPAQSMEPKWPDNPTDEQVNSGEAFIGHYEYTVTGERPLKLAPEDVIHFRQGVDPQNIRKGLSPIRGLLLEVWTDNEAAQFTAALLKNGAVPGLIISPKDSDVELPKEEIEAAKSALTAGHTRTQRGKVLGLTGAVAVEQFGFSPQQMDLSSLRDIPEERITAALGVAAAVVGFGTGLQQTKVGATMRELTRSSYRNGVVPLWRIIERTLTQQLVPAMRNGAARVSFDLEDVEALQEDANERSARVLNEVRGGVRTRGEGRQELGLDAGPSDEVYLMPISTTLLPASAPMIDVTPEERARLASGVKHEPSLLEARIIDSAPSATPTPAVLAFVRQMESSRGVFESMISDAVRPVFEAMGFAAEQEARRTLPAIEERAAAAPETKQDDDIFSEVFLAQLIADGQADLAEAYSSSFGAVANGMAGEFSGAFGIEFVLPDEAQLNVMREGGLRAGLVDLDHQTREALFDAIAEGRERGLAGDNLARLIRDRIEAGPWRDAETRARTIARTEGAHASNTASIQAARSMDDTEHMMVLDDRIGFGDETCSAINGTVVTIPEAEAMGLAHPNCTRSFTPINALLMEEMGL